MKRLRLGAILHFIIAIGHLGCLFALDEAFDAYGIKEVIWSIIILTSQNSPISISISSRKNLDVQRSRITDSSIITISPMTARK